MLTAVDLNLQHGLSVVAHYNKKYNMQILFTAYNLTWNFLRNGVHLGTISTFGMTRIKAVCGCKEHGKDCLVFVNPKSTRAFQNL